LLAPAASAGRIGLSWEASPGASGYRVYYGPASGNYTTIQNVGNTTTATLTGLPDCETVYFAVKAYNAAGDSGYSNEVASWSRPAIAQVAPQAAQQGTQFTLVLSGGSFRAGATIEIDNPHVFLGPPSISCTEIRLAATVEPTAENMRAAQVGSFRITVTNPEGLAGTRTQAFEVLINPSRFDVNRSDEGTAGRIDGKDTVWLARHFGSQEGGSLYDPDYDFNGDGWIDGAELAYLGGSFGGCWNGAAWSGSACSE
jgi:hypothetical protein